jgi:myo-inositol-1(or 4)-monophosphatase
MSPAAEGPADPHPADPAELLEVAREAAAVAVHHIVASRPAVLQVSQKSTATDHVTEMDLASERMLREVLARRRPQDAVVGEEHGMTPGRSGVTWWLDPIDGTTNYLYDHPGYAVSVAAAVVVDSEDASAPGRLLVDDPAAPGSPVCLQVLAGVVADPTHARTYEAHLGGGARQGTSALRLPQRAAPLQGSLVATGFGYDPERRRAQGAVVAALLPRVRDLRRMGAASLDLCSVASGRVDAYYEAGLSAWDLAAGVLIAGEAGARVGSLEGGAPRPGSVLAAHPERFEELRALLVAYGASGT